jgi:hypothetical protein
MQRHLELVSILHMAAGALTILVAASALALAFGAGALIPTAGFAARATSAAFAVVAALALVWGGGTLLTGAALRQRRRWARLLALGFAILNLLVIPFGTALGVYTLWVLINDRTRQLFEGGEPAR